MNRIHLFIGFCLISWGTSYIAIKMGLAGFSPYQLASYRFLVASVIFLPVLIWKRASLPTARQFGQILLIAIIGILGYHVAINLSTISFSPNAVSFVANSAPVFIAVLSVLFLKEKISMQGWSGFLIGLIGVGVMTYRDGELFDSRTGLLLAVPITSSLFFILQKPLLKKLKPYEVMGYAIITGTILLMIVDHSFLFELKSASTEANLAAIYLGIVPTAIAFNAWAHVLSKVDVSDASKFIYVIPIVTLLFSFVILGQVPMLETAVGGFIILAGVYIAKMEKK